MNKSRSIRKRSQVLSDTKELLGKPNVLKTEDAETYNKFAENITQAIGPKDFIEQILVKDVIDHTWEMLRLRRFKVRLFELPSSLRFLDPDLAGSSKRELRATEIFVENLRNYQAIDGLLAVAESSRAITLREIERRRDARAAARVRKTSDDIIEGEFRALRRRTAHRQGCDMTSARQIAANRINARKSTGPRTLRGKALARRSALRHGLSIPVLSDPVLSKEVEVLARKIAGENSRAELLAHARAVAEAQVDIERTRRARHNLLSRGLGDADHESTGQEQVPAAVIVASRMRKLARLARYERRALSRRKFATRAFDAVLFEEHFEGRQFGRTNPI